MSKSGRDIGCVSASSRYEYAAGAWHPLPRPDLVVQVPQQLTRKYFALHEAGRERALDCCLVKQSFVDEHAVVESLVQPNEVTPDDLVVEIAGSILPQAIQDRLRHVAAECASCKAAVIAVCKQHVGRDSQRQLDQRLRIDRSDDLRPLCAGMCLAGVKIRCTEQHAQLA